MKGFASRPSNVFTPANRWTQDLIVARTPSRGAPFRGESGVLKSIIFRVRGGVLVAKFQVDRAVTCTIIKEDCFNFCLVTVWVCFVVVEYNCLIKFEEIVLYLAKFGACLEEGGCLPMAYPTGAKSVRLPRSTGCVIFIMSIIATVKDL